MPDQPDMITNAFEFQYPSQRRLLWLLLLLRAGVYFNTKLLNVDNVQTGMAVINPNLLHDNLL
jgi:hypothetical protein